MVDYNIYPEAMALLKSSGIEKRITDLAESEDGIPYFGAFPMLDEVMERVRELKEKGGYKGMAKDNYSIFRGVMNSMLQSPASHKWKVQRREGVEEQECELIDLELFSGTIASLVMASEELWDYQRFGFNSPFELVAATSARILQKGREKLAFKRGYLWERKTNEGDTKRTEITGSEHCDLRIYQTITTPLQTTDPFGFPIRIRPETIKDRNLTAAYHSVEPILLAAALKYIEQE